LELNYISDPQNYEAIESNINSRKGNGSIKVFMELLSKYNSSQQADKIESKTNILTKALLKYPTHQILGCICMVILLI